MADNEETLKEEIQEEIQEEQEQESEETQEQEQEGQEEAQPEISKEDPLFRAGQDAMKEQMQKALDKRISKEVARRKAIENRFNEVAQEVAELKKNIVKEKPLPKRDEYETDEEWVGAMVEAKFGNKTNGTQTLSQPAPSPLAQDFTVREMDYAKKRPDYYENIRNLAPFMNADFQECLFEAGPEVADYLSQNIDLAEQISASRPSTMGRHIARIEEHFKRTQPLPKKAKPKAEPVTETGTMTNTNSISPNTNQWDYNRVRAKLDGYIK